MIYFALPSEPAPFAFPLLLAGYMFLSRKSWQGRLFYVHVCVAMVLVGLSVAQMRTMWVSAPVLETPLEEKGVRGWVEEIETFATGQKRVTLRVISIEDLPQAQTPDRVRIRFARKDIAISAGDAIWVRADLRPPPEPVAPGLFDFARYFFFHRIGATGFTLSQPREAWYTGEKPLQIKVGQTIERLRDGIDQHIRNVMSKPYAALASALIVGKRQAIDDEVQDKLRISGLAHILAISGLHMGLVTAFIFMLVRALLAFNSRWANRAPLRQWAALTALMVAACYLLISGMAVATIRAFIMASLVLIAIVAGRQALTMRTVAVAALVILFFWPESLLTPGFQMSFAAVIALVAAYEALRMRKATKPFQPYQKPLVTKRVILWCGFYLGGLFFTSLIAGLATGPVAQFHFHRIAPYSLVGNILAMPFVALVVMPAGLFGVALIPFGLEAGPFWMMERGLATVMAIAGLVADLPGAEIWSPKTPFSAALWMTLGFLWLMFWQRRWRLLGILPMIVGVILSAQAQRPDMIIARDGKTVAVRNVQGAYDIAGLRYGRFDAENWLRADGDGRPVAKSELLGAWECEGKLCLYRATHHTSVILAPHEHDIADFCSADYDNEKGYILVTPVSLSASAFSSCRARLFQLIDGQALARSGALNINFMTNDLLITPTYVQRSRPWE
jgi:competence protein ComEC